MNILLINIHSSLNAGDQALLEQSIRMVREAFHPDRISLCVNWPEEEYFSNGDYPVIPSAWWLAGINGRRKWIAQFVLTLRGWVWALLRSRAIRCPMPAAWRILFEAYEQADLVAGVCGNQFFSTGRFGWPLPAKLLAVFLAQAYHKPYYALPQTIGPLKRGWERSLSRYAHRKTRVLLVRDRDTETFCRDLNFPAKKIQYAPDPGLFYPPAPGEEAARLLAGYGYQTGEPALGVSAINRIGKFLPPEVIEDYFRALSAGLRAFHERYGGSIYLFDQVSGPSPMEDDRLASQRLMALLGDLGGKIRHVEGAHSPGMLKACYAKMELFIATRLHAGLFSLGSGTPTLFIGYLDKTHGVLGSLALSDLVVDIREMHPESFPLTLFKAWEDRAFIRTGLQKILGEQHRQSEDGLKTIARDYGEYVHKAS